MRQDDAPAADPDQINVLLLTVLAVAALIIF